MATMKEAASAFLANRRVAVTGVSRHEGGMAATLSTSVCARAATYEVFAGNPREVEGDPCYPDLRSIPGGVDAVVIGTRPERVEQTIRECKELGIEFNRSPAAEAVLVSVQPWVLSVNVVVTVLPFCETSAVKRSFAFTVSLNEIDLAG